MKRLFHPRWTQADDADGGVDQWSAAAEDTTHHMQEHISVPSRKRAGSVVSNQSEDADTGGGLQQPAQTPSRSHRTTTEQLAQLSAQIEHALDEQLLLSQNHNLQPAFVGDLVANQQQFLDPQSIVHVDHGHVEVVDGAVVEQHVVSHGDLLAGADEIDDHTLSAEMQDPPTDEYTPFEPTPHFSETIAAQIPPTPESLAQQPAVNDSLLHQSEPASVPTTSPTAQRAHSPTPVSHNTAHSPTPTPKLNHTHATAKPNLIAPITSPTLSVSPHKTSNMPPPQYLFSVRVSLLHQQGHQHSPEQEANHDLAVTTTTNMPHYEDHKSGSASPLDLPSPATHPLPPPPQACQEIFPFTLLPSQTPLTSPVTVVAKRKFADFKWLHKALCANHPASFVPPLNDKLFSIFQNLGVAEFSRLQALESECDNWLRCVVTHPVLCRSPLLLACLCHSDEKLKAAMSHFAAAPHADTSLIKSLTKRRGSTTTGEHTHLFDKMLARQIQWNQLGNHANSLLHKRQHLASMTTQLSEDFQSFAAVLGESENVCGILPVLGNGFAMQSKCLQDFKLQTEVPNIIDQSLQDVISFLGVVSHTFENIRSAAFESDAATLALEEVLERERNAPIDLPDAKRHELLMEIKETEKSLVKARFALDKMKGISEWDYTYVGKSLAQATRSSVKLHALNNAARAQYAGQLWQAVLEDVEAWDEAVPPPLPDEPIFTPQQATSTPSPTPTPTPSPPSPAPAPTTTTATSTTSSKHVQMQPQPQTANPSRVQPEHPQPPPRPLTKVRTRKHSHKSRDVQDFPVTE